MIARKLNIICLTIVLLLIAGFSFAADYASMTTQELAALRGTLYNATAEERAAFRTEWRKRVAEMTQEERQTYSMSGPADGTGRQLGNRGSGGGSGNGNGSGNGGGSGKGSGGSGGGSGSGGGGGKGKNR